ncbi:uncharacterized protein [Cherax quadricarinatus]|uniref:uncharacterized protein isoform X6 n=1 Tax=Cherax quadricarinatus TaxID=27406 RepID=UPI00387EA60D
MAGSEKLPVAAPSRLLRSPSHESVSTELSLFSISSAASEMSRAGLRVVLPPHLGRGPSPTPETRHRLQVSAQGNFLLQINVCGGGGRLEGVFLPRLDPTSRSCSTWVAVGDVASTSQLPSPQARPGSLESPAITAADFIRSVNKKVRQNYLKRRLVTTYKALQRFSQSEVDLDAGGAATAGVKIDSGGVTLVVPPRQQAAQDVFRIIKKEVELPVTAPASTHVAASATHNKNLSLTARDVERDRGRPLTKYERNMMIFNWLQTLEETAYDIMS